MRWWDVQRAEHAGFGWAVRGVKVEQTSGCEWASLTGDCEGRGLRSVDTR